MSPGDVQPGKPGSSSTPARPKAPAQATSSLKSTPNSRGAATISENIDLVGLNMFRPWIQRDIERTETCKVDAMLQVLLQRASLDPEIKQPDLLPRCLDAVLDVCNGKTTPPGKNPDNKLHSLRIKKALEKYILPGAEGAYYAPFIEATNIAMACLENINVDGMPAASSLNIICQQSDTKNMKQGHQNQVAKRKPDVVILPFQSSRDAFPTYNMKDPEHRITGATMKPEVELPWEDVLASIEFKRKVKQGLRPPPPSYQVTDYVATNPEHCPVVSTTAATDGPATAPSGPSQTEAKQPVPDPPAERRSARLAALPQTASSNSSSKRKAEEALQSSSKRVKVNDKDPKLDVTVQTGLYAAEMFAANVAVKHLLNLIVVDNVLWVWYYDRQGIIQCSGIDFIWDLPRFMVLLYALQRFKLKDWGRNEHFKKTAKEGFLKLDIDGVDLELHTSAEERVTHYGLKGRATNVFPVTSEYLAKKYSDDPGVKKEGMVAKIFWAEEQRTSEPEILQKVEEIAETQEAVKGRVPQLLWSHKFKNPTSAVREALGVPEPEKGSRVLYIIVFRKLLPITELYGDDFFNVWRQCILCHLALWKGGVYHRDVSPPNMMYYKTKDGVLIGILNDYDLSSLATTQGPLGNERTGTVPFMALDLLSPEGQRGKVQHLYRHDLESFIWVLVWVCLRYRQGVLLPRETRPFDEWATTDAVTCGEKKSYVMINFSRYEPSDIEPRIWNLVVECVRVLQQDAYHREAFGLQHRLLPIDAEESESDIDDEQTNAEESELDMDGFLHKFTSTKSWIRLSKRLP
ncbi:hypothetical protein DFH29DRAFT_1083311 [Suillus ampliporus]|nr:hypothetical protein DFH29DRAFT_1083311 [Suillus ampliporus]